MSCDRDAKIMTDRSRYVHCTFSLGCFKSAISHYRAASILRIWCTKFTKSNCSLPHFTGGLQCDEPFILWANQNEMKIYYSIETNLNKYVTTGHEGKKPFNCNICDTRQTRKWFYIVRNRSYFAKNNHGQKLARKTLTYQWVHMMERKYVSL